MASNTAKIIERLRLLEAQAQLQRDQAESMREECHKARMLLEGDVSTPAKKSKGIHASVAKVIAERKAFFNKKQTRQITTAGHS